MNNAKRNYMLTDEQVFLIARTTGMSLTPERSNPVEELVKNNIKFAIDSLSNASSKAAIENIRNNEAKIVRSFMDNIDMKDNIIGAFDVISEEVAKLVSEHNKEIEKEPETDSISMEIEMHMFSNTPHSILPHIDMAEHVIEYNGRPLPLAFMEAKATFELKGREAKVKMNCSKMTIEPFIDMWVQAGIVKPGMNKKQTEEAVFKAIRKSPLPHIHMAIINKNTQSILNGVVQITSYSFKNVNTGITAQFI